MNFIIADTFTKALTRLAPAEQSAVKQSAFDFQLSPCNPGFNYETLKRPRDPNFRSFRVSKDIRIILHQLGDTLMLCYVDHHRPAYDWAERRKIEVHPKTGAAQIVEVVEKEIVKQVVREVPQDPPLFATYDPDYLLALGVPPEWLTAVRHVGQEGLEKLIGRLPEEAMERLMELAMGNPVAAPIAPPNATPFTHPDAQRRFRILDSHDELRQALASPWEKWIVFLHPSQRQVVEKRFSGPACVTGAAGTGKSVVALHRAATLARKDLNARVLVTSYSRTLAARLGQSLDILMGAAEPARSRIQVDNLHSIAVDIWTKHTGRRFNPISAKALLQMVEDSNRTAGKGDFASAFLKAEWDAIIDPWGIASWEEYKRASRARRGTPLGARQKLAAWRIFENVQKVLSGSGLFTWNGICHTVAALVADEQVRPTFDHVVVDESQDLGPAELTLIRSLVAPGENDIFLCGDAGQRIFKSRFSWYSVGVDVRGRSSRLKLNYRTTEAIQRFADRLLPGGPEGGSGESEARDAVSLLIGPDPEIIGKQTAAEEVESLAEWLLRLQEEGFQPFEIGLFARTEHVISGRILPAVEQCGLAACMLSDDEPPSSEEVSVGTMHRAKGLEFKAVAVVGCDAGLMPLRSALDSLADPGDRESFIEQERQLLYVACSRARERLLVTSSGQASEFLSMKSGRLRQCAGSRTN